jgi:hypothetical protein
LTCSFLQANVYILLQDISALSDTIPFAVGKAVASYYTGGASDVANAAASNLPIPT